MDEEGKKIRHTITAEETFTLAKDVFDMRTFIKNVYSNRAVIARRINVITFIISAIFTVLYVTLVIFTSLRGKLSLGTEVVLYCLAGAYAVIASIVAIFAFVGFRTSAKNIRKLNSTLKIFRFFVRLISIAISIAAIALCATDAAPAHVAMDITMVIFSIVTIFVQALPLFFGGIIRFVRWLLSPVKLKVRVSTVVLEWYNLAASDKPLKGSNRKVAKKHIETIGAIIDSTIIPGIGKKKIISIKPVQLLELVENSEEALRPVLEGVLKSVFAYAAECGYIVFDPCRDLNFEGTVEEEKKKTFKERIMFMGTKIGKKVLDKYIAASSEEEEAD